MTNNRIDVTSHSLEKSEYEKKEGSLIYIGFGALIAHGVILYFSRKKYLKTIKKTKASANR